MTSKTNIKNNLLAGAIIFAVVFAVLMTLCFGSDNQQSADHKKVFTEIFETDAWHGGYGNRKESNGRYLNFLQYFINTVPIKSIVDIGCADWNLMRHIKIPETIDYLGIDIVDKIIENNNKKVKN